MCILFLYTNPNATVGKYKIILASNRDEYYIRNAKEATKWSSQPTIISGLDMEIGREGGTWLGLGLNETSTNKKLRIGALLNLTGEERKSGALGRGFIVTDYLKFKENSADDYINKLKAETNYNAFNFVGIEMTSDNIFTYHYANKSEDNILKIGGEQLLGFGNSLPSSALSKVKAGKDRFTEITGKYNDVSQNEELVNNLINLLKWDQRHLPDGELERRAPQTFEYLSSVFVNIPIAGYGTRTHTIILVDWQNEIQYIEDTMTCPIDQNNIQWKKEIIKAHL